MIGRYCSKKFTQYFLAIFQDAIDKTTKDKPFGQYLREIPSTETSPLKLLVRAALAAPLDNLSYKEFVETMTESHKAHPIIRLAG